MRLALLALAALAVAHLSVPRQASAQPSPLSVRGSVGAGTMVSRDQLGWLGLDSVALAGTAVASYAVLTPLSMEVRLSGSYFLSGRGSAGALAEAGAGLRLSLPAAEWLAVDVSGHVSAGWTGELLRPTLDLGVGTSFDLTEELSAGPEVVYGHVLWPDDPGHSTDARFLVLGLAVTWRPLAEPAPRETVRTVERTRTERIVEREVFFEPPVERPDDPAQLDRLLDHALPVTHREEVVLIPPVLFEFDSTRVTPGGEVALFAARDLIAEMPDDIAIEGHADGTGTDEYNAELSLARAMWVRDWLVRHGIDGSRLSVEAHGEHRHLAEERDDWTRQLSRRVTFRATRFSEEAP